MSFFIFVYIYFFNYTTVSIMKLKSSMCVRLPDWAGSNGASALNGCCSIPAVGSGGAERAALQERRNLRRSPAGMCSSEPRDPGEPFDAAQTQVFASVPRGTEKDSS